MRIIAVDVGQKRYGVAQSDLTGTLATPVGTYNQEELLKYLQEKAALGQIKSIVMGWPLNLAGQESEATARVTAFETAVKRRLPGIPVIRIDERFTSVMAQRAILESGAKKKKRQDKALVDAVAASILLQGYLDSM